MAGCPENAIVVKGVGFNLERKLTVDPLFSEKYANKFGVDVKVDSLDYNVLGNGDLQTISGLELFLVRFQNALVTVPGEVWWDPTWGIGLQRHLNQKATQELIGTIESDITQFALSDPAVQRLDPLRVGVGQSLIKIDVGLWISDVSLPASFELRGA